MVGAEGFEPSNIGIKTRCLSPLGDTPTKLIEIKKGNPCTLHRNRFGSYGASLKETTPLKLVGDAGIEPTTLCSQSRCSTRLS